MHVHCQKAEKECKYWLDAEEFSIREAYAYGISPADRRMVRNIIFNNFDHVAEQWQSFQEER